MKSRLRSPVNVDLSWKGHRMPSVHEWVRCRTDAGDELPLADCNRLRSFKGLEPLTAIEPAASQPLKTRSERQKPMPPLWQRVTTFADAAVRHKAIGSPIASDVLIRERLAICQSCPQFDGAHCRECGCGCKSQSTYFNKLAWADASCPHPDGPKWGPVLDQR